MVSPQPIISPMRPGGRKLKYTLGGPDEMGLIACGGGQFEHGHACGANKSPRRPARMKFTRTLGDPCVSAVGG